jgi:hypothetical protein
MSIDSPPPELWSQIAEFFFVPVLGNPEVQSSAVTQERVEFLMEPGKEDIEEGMRYADNLLDVWESESESDSAAWDVQESMTFQQACLAG